MLDKLTKGLSGLGGAAALTTGGVFLKNHVVRVNFLKNHDSKIIELKNQVVSSSTGFNEDQIYFLRSDEPDEFWEWLWIGEVGSGKWDKNIWTKEDMAREEENFWKNTNQMPQEHKKAVDEKYPYYPYWKKYRELCFLWNSVRDGGENGDINPSGDHNLCFTSYSWETYKTRDWYKKYKKLKESKEEINIGEYYWTLWMKFTKKCDSEISNKNNDSAQILQLFDTWRSNSGTCSIA